MKSKEFNRKRIGKILLVIFLLCLSVLIILFNANSSAEASAEAKSSYNTGLYERKTVTYAAVVNNRLEIEFLTDHGLEAVNVEGYAFYRDQNYENKYIADTLRTSDSISALIYLENAVKEQLVPEFYHLENKDVVEIAIYKDKLYHLFFEPSDSVKAYILNHVSVEMSAEAADSIRHSAAFVDTYTAKKSVFAPQKTVKANSYDLTNNYEAYTNSDNLYDSKTNTNMSTTINDYFGELFGKGELDNYRTDDPIVNIVPKNLFTTVGHYTYVGKEYGFFIDTTYADMNTFRSDVMIFDISVTESASSGTKRELSYRVKPLFKELYRTFDKATTTDWSNFDPSLSIVVCPYGFQTEKSDFYYLRNIEFGFYVMNERALNQGDPGYSMSTDNGAILNQVRYNLKAYGGLEWTGSWQDTTYMVMNRFGGYIPVIGPYVEKGMNIIDEVKGIIEDGQTVSNLFSYEKIIAEANNEANIYTYKSRQEQLATQNTFTKEAVVCQSDVDANKDLVYAALTDHYAEAICVLDNTQQATRLYSTISLEVVEDWNSYFLGAHVFGEYDLVSSGYGTNYTVLFDAPREQKNLDLNEDSEVYILPEGINYYQFTPRFTGEYIFSTSGNANSPKLVLNNVADQVVSDNTIKAYLIANQTYYLEASLLSKTGYGRYNLRVECIEKNDLGAIDINTKDSYRGAILQFVPTQSAPVEIQSSNNSLSFEIYDENLNRIESSTTSRIAYKFEQYDLYYIVVKNNTVVAQSSTINFAEPQTISKETDLIVTTDANKKYYKFSSSELGNFTFTIQGSNLSNLQADYDGITNVDAYVSSKMIIFNFSLTENQVVYFGLESNSTTSITVRVDKTENTFVWVVGGTEINGNTVNLKRNSTNSIRLKANGQFVENPIIKYSVSSNGYYNLNPASTYHNLTISNNCLLSNDKNEFKISLYLFKDESTVGLHVSVLHNLNTSISKYSDNSTYGLKLPTFTSIIDEKIDIIYKVEANDGQSIKDNLKIGNVRVSQNFSLQNVVENTLAYDGFRDVEVTIKYITLKQGTNNTVSTEIYNTSAGYTDQLQEFTLDTIKVNPMFGTGSGYSWDPYTIHNERHLKNIRNAVSTRTTYPGYGEETAIFESFKLMASINLGWDELWTPISHTYKGTFDGNGHYLKYKIDVPGTAYSDDFKFFGFFESASNATFKNLEIWNANMSGSTNTHTGAIVCAGLLVGTSNSCTYQNVSVENSYSRIYRQNSWVGLLVGNDGFSFFDNCSVDGEIVSQGETGGIAGVILGSDFYQCSNSSTIEWWYYNDDYGQFNAGGIVGRARGGSFEQCTNMGMIKYGNKSPNDSRTLAPCLGQIVGYAENSPTFTNNNCNGTVEKGLLQKITWTTGALWWKENHEHLQYKYVSQGQYGRWA